jgi:ribonuclease HI
VWGWCHSISGSMSPFQAKLAVGPSTKNREELYAMWLLLKTTADKGIKKLQVFGDSKLMVD